MSRDKRGPSQLGGFDGEIIQLVSPNKNVVGTDRTTGLVENLCQGAGSKGLGARVARDRAGPIAAKGWRAIDCTDSSSVSRRYAFRGAIVGKRGSNSGNLGFPFGPPS